MLDLSLSVEIGTLLRRTTRYSIQSTVVRARFLPWDGVACDPNELSVDCAVLAHSEFTKRGEHQALWINPSEHGTVTLAGQTYRRGVGAYTWQVLFHTHRPHPSAFAVC